MTNLRCVNIAPIQIETPFELLLCVTDKLELGKVYTTPQSEPYQSDDCLLVYDIDGIGEQLAERFEMV